jgi:hypothetical protein
MRENQEFQAKQALLRWRRVHTRATIDNLTKTLMFMRRRDIVEKINDELTKKSKSTLNDKKQAQQRSVRLSKVTVGHPMKLKIQSAAAVQ